MNEPGYNIMGRCKGCDLYVTGDETGLPDARPGVAGDIWNEDGVELIIDKELWSHD